jgi:hypothetical protein
MAEVRWDVTTPGGRCRWQSYLSPGGGNTLSAASASDLPPGKSTLLFHFDGADIAAAGSGQWTFQATARCDGRNEYAEFRRAPVDVAPATFEPLRRAVELQAGQAVDSPRPGVWSTNRSVNAPERGVPFTIVAPPEIQARLINVYNAAPSHFATLEMTLAPGAPPGRYFVEVTASSGQQQSTRRVPVVVYSAVTP